MGKAAAILTALMFFFVLPAVLTITGVFQSYVTTEVGTGLGELSAFVTSSWKFIVIGLFILGLFFKLKNKGD